MGHGLAAGNVAAAQNSCPQWCINHPKPWALKCKWKTLGGLKHLDAAHGVGRGSSECGTCPQCADVDTSAHVAEHEKHIPKANHKCKPFCKSSTKAWKHKCNWLLACGAC